MRNTDEQTYCLNIKDFYFIFILCACQDMYAAARYRTLVFGVTNSETHRHKFCLTDQHLGNVV